MNKIKRYTPHKIKEVRQEFLLKRAKSLTGLQSGFPVPEAPNFESRVYVVGSGASILDFDLGNPDLDASLSVSLNDAIFLPMTHKFHSYEGSRIPVELDKALKGILVGSNIEVLCRIPVDLRTLTHYPDAVLSRPSKSHLFTSVDALSEDIFDEQMKRYLGDKVSSRSPGLDPGFSLGRIIVRLLKLGYKDIRLLGIDLFTPEHFWHFSDYHKELLGVRKEKKNVHPTAVANWYRDWTAPDFLQRLHKLEGRFGYRLSTHSRSGSANILPTWKD